MATRTLARPRQTITVRMPSRASKLARRGLTAAGKAALSERHTLAALGAAAVMGYLDKPDASGRRTELPHVQALGRAGTYGLAAWAIGRFSGSPMVQHAATGLLSIQLYRMASGQTDTTSGMHGMAGAMMGGTL
jgi:hypothetical protein